MKQKIILALAVVAGILAFWMSNRYLGAERARLYRGAEQIQVLAAARDLPEGSLLQFEDLGTISVFRTAVGENVFRPEQLDRVLGKRLRFGLRRREPLWWSHVDVPDREREGLAVMVKPGLRALSIAVGGENAVSGLVRPNDRVDILGTFSLPARTQTGEDETMTLTVLQDVTVLATGQRMARDDLFGEALGRNAHGYSAVTLEVTPREAELLVFAQQARGRLTLTLRNPEDVSFEQHLPETDFRQIERTLEELNLFRQRSIRHKRDF